MVFKFMVYITTTTTALNDSQNIYFFIIKNIFYDSVTFPDVFRFLQWY